MQARSHIRRSLLIATVDITMKHRFLHVIFGVLVLLSGVAGTTMQKAVISSSSDDVKIVTVHSSAQEISPVVLNESKIIGRTVIRSTKKSTSAKEFSLELFLSSIKFSFNILFSKSKSTFVTSRVLLLPKQIKTVIFLQTLL